MAVLEIGSIVLELNRKAIKNLHISVLPPDGKVRVSAPLGMTETAIRMAVISRIPWIKKQQSDFAKQARQSDREMVSGECHYLWGKRLRLDLVERGGRASVELAKSRLRMGLPASASVEERLALLDRFYRRELKNRIEELLPYWQENIGVIAVAWGVKKMKTKWGSCNTEAKRIWLNLELAKKPPECLEFVLVHELVHLHERHHNERFRALMDKHLPDWAERRSLLNSMPLAKGHWLY